MNKPVLIVGALAVLVTAFLFARGRYETEQVAQETEHVQSNADHLVRADAVSHGPADADVTIVEFFDPACETCALFHPYVEQLLARNPDRLRVVYRYAPFHPGSEEIVKVLEASRQQGMYDQALQALFSTQADWASHHDPQPDRIWQHLGTAGLDLARLREDATSLTLDTVVAEDIAACGALGVRKTPTFFVNGKPLARFGLQELVDLVQSELAATGG